MVGKGFKEFVAAAYLAAIVATAAVTARPALAVEIDGARLFARECADCHGPDGRGRMLNQPDFTDRRWHERITNEQMFKSIKWGKEPMPFYAGALTDDEIAALVKYIRSLPVKDGGGGESKDGAARSGNCSSCHQKNGDPVVALFAPSTHAAVGVTCDRCHKGDAEAAGKAEAHRPPFVGKPSPEEIIAMCGSCHRAQLAQFKTSRHFPERAGVTRLDCVQCHGAHTVGVVSPNFSFAYFCSGCHGLEYLPELPASLQKMLGVLDEVREAGRKLGEAGRAPSGEIVNRRKELRRVIGEVVHTTDARAAAERLAHITELGRWLKQAIEREGR
jgi:mono/diheme cytochrome c family protein